MNEQPASRFELRRDGLGILLFTAGAFFSVLIALALASAEPLDRAVGTAALARVWARSLGLAPGLLFSAGCAVLGARLFLAGGLDVRRGAIRLAVVAFGLSVLLGAFSPAAGGFVGDLTAGALSRATGTILGAVAGFAVFAVAVWVSWVKPAQRAVAGAGPALEEVASRPQEHGVSAEEAAALIPEELPSWRAEPRMESAVTQIPNVATQAYREDVRRRGEIPEGARPLDTSHGNLPLAPGLPAAGRPTSGIARPIHELEPGPLQHGTPRPELVLPADAPDEDLARAEELEGGDEIREEVGLLATDAEESEELTEEDELSEVEIVEEDFELDPAVLEALEEEPAEEDEPEADLAESDEEEADEVVALEVVADEEEDVILAGAEVEIDIEPAPRPAVPPLRPSWEQSSLFEPEEEPVDAYGTPLAPVPEREPVSANADSAAEAEAPGKDEDAEDVILKPVAPRKKAKKSRAPKVENERSRLLTEVGCLLLDRGRVAVSMLQKQYDMDFEEATRVLDELQALGLIGPYLGGKRRDILLTRDEWLEKVSTL